MQSEPKITGTLVWYYYICHREVWLMSRQLGPSEENPFIEIGRLISEESYKRERKEIRVGNLVIDLLRVADRDVIIGEVKKSSRYEKSATMQLAFYLICLSEIYHTHLDPRIGFLHATNFRRFTLNL